LTLETDLVQIPPSEGFVSWTIHLPNFSI
jgi:hypothetical protein